MKNVTPAYDTQVWEEAFPLLRTALYHCLSLTDEQESP